MRLNYLIYTLVLLILLILYLGIHAVLSVRLFIKHADKKTTILSSFLYIVIVVLAFFCATSKKTIIKDFGFGILLTFLYMILSFFIYDLIYFLSFLIKGKFHVFFKKRKTKKICVIVVMCIGLFITVLGYINAKKIHVVNYQVTINKENIGRESLNAVLISDIHLGTSIGKNKVQRMVDRINELEPDIVFIAGDIFDNDFDGLKEPSETAAIFRTIQSKYGVFACLGNHDIDHIQFRNKAEENGTANDNRNILNFLKEADITLLDDEAILIADWFYVVGRKESRMIGGEVERLSLDELLDGVDHSKPIFLMDHRPEAAEEAMITQIDLMMSGHTHNGQIFPGNIMIKKINDYGYGYAKAEDTTIIVTSGIGYWGPAYRIKSNNEIVKLEIIFSK